MKRECGLRRSGNKRIWEGRECGEGGEKDMGVERGGIGRREWGGGGEVADVHSIYVLASNILCVT